jgi:hypothetical protein
MSSDALGLLAGLLASNVVPMLAKKTTKTSARQGRKAQGRRGRLLASGYGGMNPTNGADLRVKPPDLRSVPRRVPRNVASLIAWDVVKVNSVISTTSSPVETNFAAQLSTHPQYASWVALFDQYCIPQFTIEIDSEVTPNGSGAPPMLYTAIDFDNVGSLGSVQAIEDFATCEYVAMGQNRRHMRSVRPCVQAALQLASGSASSSGVGEIGPMWINSAQSTVYHYGIRTIFGAGAVYSMNVTWTVWFAFRNQV